MLGDRLVAVQNDIVRDLARRLRLFGRRFESVDHLVPPGIAVIGIRQRDYRLVRRRLRRRGDDGEHRDRRQTHHDRLEVHSHRNSSHVWSGVTGRPNSRSHDIDIDMMQVISLYHYEAVADDVAAVERPLNA